PNLWPKCSVTFGSGRAALIFLIPTSNRLWVRSANTTASSCATRWCCAAAPAQRRNPTFERLIAISSRPTRAGNLRASGWRMATSKRLQFIATDAMALEVREGLSATPKHLPAKLFYDEIGSALFEQITELPEYYLTRTERSILERFASEILEQAGPSLTLAELGAGTASKTCILIEELLRRQSRALFYPIDVSPSALDEA